MKKPIRTKQELWAHITKRSTLFALAAAIAIATATDQNSGSRGNAKYETQSQSIKKNIEWKFSEESALRNQIQPKLFRKHDNNRKITQKQNVNNGEKELEISNKIGKWTICWQSNSWNRNLATQKNFMCKFSLLLRID